MSSAARFFLKPGYSENLAARTYEADEPGSFWNEERLRSSRVFQYHVYALARALARRGPPPRVLDVGCGPGFKLQTLLARHSAELVGVDQPSLAALAGRVLRGGRFVSADLERIDLELGSRFDLVLCVDVLEHLVDPMPCLGFVRRHLDAGGVAVLSTPERDVLRGRACDRCLKPEHVREWNAAEFRRLVEHAGLEVIDQRLLPQARLPAPELWLSRLLSPWIRSRRWSSCQVVLGRRPPEADRS